MLDPIGLAVGGIFLAALAAAVVIPFLLIRPFLLYKRCPKCGARRFSSGPIRGPHYPGKPAEVGGCGACGWRVQRRRTTDEWNEREQPDGKNVG